MTGSGPPPTLTFGALTFGPLAFGPLAFGPIPEGTAGPPVSLVLPPFRSLLCCVS